MRGKTVCVIALVLVFAFMQDAHAKRTVSVKVKTGGARVTLIEGWARVMPAGTDVWKPLAVNNFLTDGDQVKTGPESRIEMIMADNSRLRFADNTRFRIVNIDINEREKKKNVDVHLVLGRTWARVSKTLGVGARFELSSKNAVAGVRGTVYRMNVSEDESTLVRVYDGKVAVAGGGEVPAEKVPPALYTKPHKIEGPKPIPGPTKVTMEAWVYIIKSMQQIRVRSDGVAEKPRDFTEEEDKNDWVDWNKERDALEIKY